MKSAGLPISPGESFAPKMGAWDAAKALDGLTRAEVSLDDERVAALEEFFWYDLCAEYDAIHLHEYLGERASRFSPDFLALEDAWWRDEHNHYRGFRRLYSLLYGESEESIDVRLSKRRPDFGPIEQGGFLDDEFRLGLLMAYDELATCRAYHIDFELYREMGAPFLDWIRRITRDESFHMQNAIALIRLHHGDRVSEIPSVIREFIQFDYGGHRYRATFLFDHEWDYVDGDFFRDNGRQLMKSFDFRDQTAC